MVSRCYLRGSIILTSNKSYGEWADIFADQVLAAAILDRPREKRKAGIFSELTEPDKEGRPFL